MPNYRRIFALLLTILSLTIARSAMGADLLLAQADSGSSAAGAAQKKTRLVELWQPGDAGERMNIRGRVTSIDGTPIAGVRIFLRQADANGDYHDERYNAVLESDQKGRYQFGSVVPGNYFGPKHVHVAVNHDGYEYHDTQILFRGDPAIDENSEPNAIFLEESTVKGETILFGRFDIRLTPN